MLNACVAGCGACGGSMSSVCAPAARAAVVLSAGVDTGAQGCGATRAGVVSKACGGGGRVLLMRAPRMPPVCGRAALQVLRCARYVWRGSRRSCRPAPSCVLAPARGPSIGRKLGRIRDTARAPRQRAAASWRGGALFERIHTFAGACTPRSHKRHNYTHDVARSATPVVARSPLPSTPYALLRLPALITTTSIRERSEHAMVSCGKDAARARM